MDNSIASLVEPVKTFDVGDIGKSVNDYFIANPGTEGVVICDKEQPAGIVMRSYYYQKIGQQYGYSLYSGRPLALMMKTDILILDAACDLARFGHLAMDRQPEDVYDFVAVMDNGRLLGAVSIRNFLVEMSNAKEHEIELLREHNVMIEQARQKEKEYLAEVERMNRDLAVRSDSIKNLLDNAGQGFLTINDKLIVTDEFSNECVRIFGVQVGGRPIASLLASGVEKDALEAMTDIFRNVFSEENKLRNKVYMSLLPGEIRINNRAIQFVYKIIRSGTEKQIMFILTDITQRKHLEQKMEEEKTNMRLAVKAVMNKNDIVATLQELEAFYTKTVFDTLAVTADFKQALASIFRTVHTFKGNLAQLSMTHTSNTLHGIENDLQRALDAPASYTSEQVAGFFRRISYAQLVEDDVRVITDTLGQDYFRQDETVAVDKHNILAIEEKIRSLCSPELSARLLPSVKKLRYQNFKNILMKYNEYLLFTAEKLEKEMNDITVLGDDVFIDADKYRPFTKSLTNIFRNIADHAIEPPDERIDKGKNVKGSVTCKLVEQEPNNFVFSIQDDGRGIDFARVREKALEKGLYSPEELAQFSPQKLLELVLLDNFSTKDSVTAISGRGMGLSAVKAEIEQIGGKMEIDTEPGAGTKFVFRLPQL